MDRGTAEGGATLALLVLAVNLLGDWQRADNFFILRWVTVN